MYTQTYNMSCPEDWRLKTLPSAKTNITQNLEEKKVYLHKSGHYFSFLK